MISLILRALPTFKDTIVINRLLLMYSWIENPIWILNPTLDLGPWNVKWSRSNPPPRINPSNPLFRFRRIFNRNPWHFRELDPTLRIQEKVLKSVLKTEFEAPDWAECHQDFEPRISRQLIGYLRKSYLLHILEQTLHQLLS